MDEINTSRFNGPEYGCVLGRVSDPDLVFLPALYPVPDPVFTFLWIRIRFSNLSGSVSGFLISLDPDPVSARILEQKKECRKGS